MRGADLIWARLAAGGVTTCFANPGTSEMHLVAALDRTPGIRAVLGLQENVVTGAADGFGRMTDAPAVTLLHLGPGLANGLANLHNARRAGTPVLNLVGDYNAEHLAVDAPLASGIDSLARPMSDWTGRIGDVAEIDAAIDRALVAARAPGVATLTIPADVTWSEVAHDAEAAPVPEPALTEIGSADLERVATACRSNNPPVFVLSRRALREKPLRVMAGISRATGARFFARGANARIERGAGRVPVDRLPYSYDAAARKLTGAQHLVLVDAALPTTFFPYPGQPALPMPEDCEVLTLCPPGADARAALLALAERLGVNPDLPPPASLHVPVPPTSGTLDLAAVNAIIAASLPDEAIVCDEVITSTGFYEISAGSAPHDYLQLTGGAIGGGIPMAAGAAVACPGRKVIALQADGSGLFTVQALWTIARERLDVTVVIFANRAYRILQNEMLRVGVNHIGPRAGTMLSLDDPAPDWVRLSEGFGVEAARARTLASFHDLWRQAMAGRTPFLIEVVL